MEKRIGEIVAAIEDGGYSRTLADRLRRLEAEQDALSERITLTPGPGRGQIDATLHGDLGTVLDWAAGKARKSKTDTSLSGVSVSVVAGARLDPLAGLG